MALTAKLTVKLAATLTSVLDNRTAKDPLDYEKVITLTNGTGANQSDQMWHDQRTLSASASENLDLAGSLTNAFGTTLTFARIKMIVVFAAAANTNNVQVGGAATSPDTGFVNWVADESDILNVRPGGVFVLASPDATAYAVTAGTGDLLKIANSAGGSSVTYDLILVGSTA